MAPTSGMILQTQVADSYMTRYNKRLIKTLFENSILLNLTHRMSDFEISGDEINFFVEQCGSSNFGMRGAGEYLPANAPAKLKKAKLSGGRGYGTITIDNDLQRGYKSADTVVDEVERQLKAMQANIERHMNRMVLFDGTGKLATVNVSVTVPTLYAAGSAIPVTHPFGETIMGPQYLRRQDLITFVTPSGTNPRRTQIASKSNRNSTITCTDDVILTGRDWIVLGDPQGNNYGKELQGVERILDTTQKYANLDTTDVQGWEPYNVTLASENYDAFKVMEHAYAMTFRAGVGDVVSLWHPALWIEHPKLEEPGVRYMKTDLNFKKALEVPVLEVTGRKIPVILNTDQGFGDVLFVDKKYFGRAEITPWQWNKGVNGFWNPLEGRDASWAYRVWKGNVVGESRAAFGRIRRFKVREEMAQAIHAQM